MKNILKIFGLVAVLVFSATSCTSEDNTIDGVFDDVTNGAVLRTITEPADILNEVSFSSDEGVFIVEIEEQDNQDGALLQSVDLFVSFTDNTVDVGDSSDINDAEVMIGTIGADAFSPGPFGLPRTTLSIDVSTIYSSLGVNLAQTPLFGGDIFTIRLALNLTDGRVFSAGNAGGVITGGFFNSPFQYLLTVVCPVDNDNFLSGNYLLEETTGNTDPFGGNYGPHYPPSQNITLAGSGTMRTFDYIIYPDSFVFGQTGTIFLNCGKIQFTSTSTGGSLGCTGGANTIEDIHAEPRADYDPNLIDDAVIEFDVQGFGNDDGGCGVGSYPIHLRFTKQ